MGNCVKILSAEVARKIAAGEVIDRPASVVRELLDNSVDAGAKNIAVEITSGGIEKIRVVDDGEGLSKDDLALCAQEHATSKIEKETDLLTLSTLGFRGEALASIAAVSRLSITSGGWNMRASIVEDHVITPCTPFRGTIVSADGIFENFPARRVFLKRAASEASACRAIFLEKAIARPDISFRLKIDGKDRDIFRAPQTFTERFRTAISATEPLELFHEVSLSSDDDSWRFTLIIGTPDVSRNSKKDIFVYVNAHRVQEYSLVQAIEYGSQGFFPNGTHPAASLFVEMRADLIDFNIHPAKREVRFKDISPLHHALSTATRDFFKSYTLKEIAAGGESEFSKSFFPRELGSYGKNYNEDFIDDSQTEGYSDFEKDVSAKIDSTLKEMSKPEFLHPNYAAAYTANRFSKSAPFSMQKSQKWGEMKSIKTAERQKVSPVSLLSHSASQNGDFKYIGSALGTFLLAEKNNTLYIIDQHAAHERILFNAIMQSAGEKQPLLIPLRLKTQSEAEDEYLESVKKELFDAGFDLEKKNGFWLIKSVPIRYKGSEKDFYEDIVKMHVEPSRILYHVAASTACRAAVMDGDILAESKAEEIACEALSLKDPHCPHGRPIFHKITRAALFSLVKRT